MNKIATLILTLFLGLSSQMAPQAHADDANDAPIRIKDIQVRYDVNPDGSYTQTEKWSVLILKESALENYKQSSMTYNSTIASGKILEAYTIKKNGDKKEVPQNNYQVTKKDGYKNGKPLYSDETTISILYPDLEVGDIAVIAYQITNREGMFPNQFSVSRTFSKYVIYDNATVTVTAPKTMQLRQEYYFVTQEKTTEQDDRQALKWTYKNPNPEKWSPENQGITQIKEIPGIYVSTFKSYEEIAKAYGSRAIPKAKVTDNVKALASNITAGKQSNTEQAKALYEWVAKNLSYGGNCIGIGAVVPRDVDTIIQNKEGDCKDHATLLQALLKAKGIPSDQALVNSGDLFELPKTPVVGAINHVINYIPEMNVYLDSTTSNMPFGILPIQLSGKPVILTADYKEDLKIPAADHSKDIHIAKYSIKIAQDGSAKGTAEIHMEGLPAVNAKAAMEKISQLPQQYKPYIVQQLLAGQGLHGTGNISAPDQPDFTTTYDIKTTFSVEDFLNTQNSTGMPIRPLAMTFLPIAQFVQATYEPVPNRPTLCQGGQSIEEYTYEFPDTQNLLSIPKNLKVSNEIIEYSATYSRSGNILTAKRELKDKTPTTVCSVAFNQQYKDSARPIANDLKAQVLIESK